MGTVEAQPAPAPASLYIGQNGHGRWIVTDGAGRCGGIFTQRKDALQFAMSRHRASAVFMVPAPIALSFAPVIHSDAQPLGAACGDCADGSAKMRLAVSDDRSPHAEPFRR